MSTPPDWTMKIRSLTLLAVLLAGAGCVKPYPRWVDLVKTDPITDFVEYQAGISSEEYYNVRLMMGCTDPATGPEVFIRSPRYARIGYGTAAVRFDGHRPDVFAVARLSGAMSIIKDTAKDAVVPIRFDTPKGPMPSLMGSDGPARWQ